MKVYEASTLFDTMSTRRREYETLREQLITLQKAFQSIVELDEALKGKGADAIKGFYQAQLDVLSLWLQLVDRNIAFFSEVPERAASRNLENETVELPFLEDELSNSESRAREMIADQQEDLQRIFDRISDIQPLQVFSRNEVDQQLDEAKMKREKTIESVEQFDEELTSKYTMMESDEQVLTALFSELMNASSQGSQVSSIYYDAESFHSSDIYSAIAASQAEATGVKKEQTSQEVESAVEENENPFIESVNSFKEIGSDFWAGFQERGDKKMDSLYDFGNYLTSGLFDGVRGAVNAMDERSDKAMDSPYDFVNYLTSGGADLVKGAVNPEDDFSKEHWLSSFGLASMVAGAKVGVSKNSSEHIVKNTPFRNYSAKEAVNSVNETSIKFINETDRKKIQSWTYPPSNEKYLKYKEVFDNPKYYNQETGNINWPPNNGFDVEPVVVTLDNGVLIDRYGNPGGTFVSPEGIPYEQRALALHSDEAPYHKYEILIPFDVEAGKIAPWFDRPGGGTQYFTGNMEVLDIDTGEMVVANVENLERLGYIREIK